MMIDASDEDNSVWANAISENGMALFKTPMIRNAPHKRGLRGSLRLVVSTRIQKTIAAPKTRNIERVIGGISRIAISVKKNDPPHKTDSVMSISHVRGDIRIDIGAGMILQRQFSSGRIKNQKNAVASRTRVINLSLLVECN